MEGNLDRKLRLPRIHFWVLLHATNIRHGTNGFTSLPKERVLRIFSPDLNPRTWVPKASTLPPDHGNCLSRTYTLTLWLHPGCLATSLKRLDYRHAESDESKQLLLLGMAPTIWTPRSPAKWFGVPGRLVPDSPKQLGRHKTSATSCPAMRRRVFEGRRFQLHRDESLKACIPTISSYHMH